MAVFQWVGGYTDWRGFGSGYSGNFKGSGKEVWTSIWNGVTGISGDRAFAPYYWGFTQNWLERTPRVPTNECPSPYNYLTASRLPRGGDKVVFGWKYDPCQIFPLTQKLRANVSCLFGGLSGADEVWLGASTNITGDVEVEVLPEYGEMSHSTFSGSLMQRVQLRFGPVGYGYYWGNWLAGQPLQVEDPSQEMLRGRIGFNSSEIALLDGGLSGINFTFAGDKADGLHLVYSDNYIDPLDLRFSSFENRSTGARVYLRQRSSESSTSVVKQTNFYAPLIDNQTQNTAVWAKAGSTGNFGEMMVSGRFLSVEQDNGYISSLNYRGSGLTATDIFITENIVGANFDEDTRIANSIVCTPKYSRSTINIHCGVPYLRTDHDLNQRLGYPGSIVLDGIGAITRAEGLTFNIGNRYGLAATESCTFTEWRIGFFGGTGINKAGEPTPTVNMFRFQADAMYANGGYMRLSPDSVAAKPVFRDGYMRNNAVLDLRNENNNPERTAEIGLFDHDEGLRMDSLFARIRFAKGHNFVIDSKGDPNGLT